MSATAEPAAAKLRLVAGDRLPATARTWSSPLPPSLHGRVPEARRAAHERLLEAWRTADARVTELAGKLEEVRTADEEALRTAIAGGKRPPKEKAAQVEAELEQARRTMETPGAMLAESGQQLLADVSDEDLRQAIAEAKRQSAAIVEHLPQAAAGILAELRRSGEVNAELLWIGRLLERRRQAPWQPRHAPASSRLAAAREAAERLKEMLAAELEEQRWKGRPPRHKPPSGMQIPEGHQLTSSSQVQVVDQAGAPIGRGKPPPGPAGE
jgi:hypothetical protein